MGWSHIRVVVEHLEGYFSCRGLLSHRSEGPQAYTQILAIWVKWKVAGNSLKGPTHRLTRRHSSWALAEGQQFGRSQGHTEKD